MKKRTAIFVLLSSLLICLRASGQGTFTFNNSAATAITNVATAARASNLTVALYFSANTNAVTNYGMAMLLNPNSITNLAFPGVFVGEVRSVPGVAAGAYIAAEVWAWSGNFSNATDAQAAWDRQGCTGETILIGKSQRFLLGPLGATNAAGPSILGPGKMTPFTVGPNLGVPPPCSTPTFTLLPGLPMRLRIMGSNDVVGMRFQVESCGNLPADDWDLNRRATNWQTMATFFPSSFPYVWTNSVMTNVHSFFRLKVTRP